jgi:hypothetical protein
MAVRQLAALLTLLSLTACGTTVASGVPGLVDQGLGGPTAPTAAPQLTTAPLVPGQPTDPMQTPGTVTSSPTSTHVPGNTATTPGTFASDHRPVKVGILYANNDAAAGAGVDNGTSFTPRHAYEALVKAWNARGGLGGRRINPVYAEIKSSSTSYATDLQTICTLLTQDEHVAVILNVAGIYLESFDQCVGRAGVPLVSGDYALGDDQALTNDRGFVSVATITTDSRMRILLEQLSAAGRLTPTDKLGVVVEGCPFNQRTYDRTVVPVAKHLGVPVSDHFLARCFQNISDFGGLASEMQSAVLRFARNGITQVTFVSGGAEGNLMLLFATAAQSQAYHPKYALTSAAAPTVQEANTPKAQLANATGLGWLPSLDTSQAAPVTATQQRCLAELRSGGITTVSPADRYFAFSICDTLSLYDATLRLTLGATTREVVLSAVQSLATSYSGSTTYGGTTDFRSGRRTGPAQGRLFTWSTGCGCFTYTGHPFTLS